MTVDDRVSASPRASSPGGLLSSDRPWALISALSGCIFAVLVLLSGLITGGTPPTNGSSLRTITDYYRNHHTAVLVGDYFLAIAVYFFYGFIVTLRNAVRRSETGDAMFSAGGYASGVTLAAVLLVSAALDAALNRAIGPTTQATEPALIHGLFYTGFILFAFSGIAAAGVALSTSFQVLRARFLPVWTAWLGLLVGLLTLLSPLVVFADKDNLLTTITVAGTILFLVWTFIVSALLTRQVARTT